MFQQDWIVQQIQMLVQFIAKLVFKKNTVEYQIADYDNLTDTDRVFLDINKLLDDNNICDAEDLIFEKVEEDNLEYLKLAVDFYQRISVWNDEELEAADFSRDEIYSGLGDIMQIFGLPKIS